MSAPSAAWPDHVPHDEAGLPSRLTLYYTPNACSLATHIVLRESGLDFELVNVDLVSRRTERGEDYAAIHPKGYVPALALEDGQLLAESVALLDWLSQITPALKPADEWARTRQIEMLAFLSTQLHKPFVRLFFEEDAAQRLALTQEISERLYGIARRLEASDYLLDGRYGVADAFLYVMVRWGVMLELTLSATLLFHAEGVEARPAVIAALAREELQPIGERHG